MSDAADAFLRRLARRYPVDPRYLQNIRPLVARIFARPLSPRERERLLRLVEKNLKRQAASRGEGQVPPPDPGPVWGAGTQAGPRPGPVGRARLFGEFLLARGVLRPETLLGALEEQVRSRPLLGWLAERRGYLRPEEVLQVLRRQRVDPRRFGDLARALGYLDERQRQILLWLQARYTPRLGRILVERGDLTEAALRFFLEEFREDRTVA